VTGMIATKPPQGKSHAGYPMGIGVTPDDPV